MINNPDSTTSLNNAFELILKIFNEERLCYEKAINSLKDKVSELEESLIKVKKENKSYQSKISNLKGKLKSISKTVSKLEDSDFTPKPEKRHHQKIIQNEELNGFNINDKNFSFMKNKKNESNNDILNSLKYKSKLMQDKNKSTSINHQYIKLKILDNDNDNDNDKLNINEEDIKRNYYIKKTHKKTLSTKIKNCILHNVHESHLKKGIDDNTYKSHCFNDKDDLYLMKNNSNINESDRQRIENKTVKVKKKQNLGRDKYNKIDQKIRGLKSTLSFYNRHDLLNSAESYNSINS
jgi:hypothetical protein